VGVLLSDVQPASNPRLKAMTAQRRITFMRPMLSWHTLNENVDVKHFKAVPVALRELPSLTDRRCRPSASPVKLTSPLWTTESPHSSG
jgi:hypothetical protein